MRRTPVVVSSLFAIGFALSFGSTSGCGGSGGNSRFADGGSSSGSNGSSGSSSGLFGDDGGGSSGGSSGGGMPVTCPAGADCNVDCGGGANTTSISGFVYDPALADGLYNVFVYVPGGPLEDPLPAGAPGAGNCACGELFKSGAITSAVTKVDGSFNLPNMPVGTAVPVVIQIGKWRRQFTVNTMATKCMNAAQPDKMWSLPGSLTQQYDSMPQIAVSTGSADTLECLMHRIGLPKTEYTAGAGGTGHVHVFSGGDKGGGGGVGTPEKPSMAMAPESDLNLWVDAAHLMPYDIVLLSCEGGETYNANPAALESYLNDGGRAFASHFHYSWFSGPLDTAKTQTYKAPADWGNALATWTAGGGGDNGEVDGLVDQTLNVGGGAFVKGQMLQQWLGINKALGVNTTVKTDVSIYQPRYDAVVAASNAPSQPWITSGTNTMYFSFDTPIGGTPSPGGGAPTYCGRAVFSDLHVDGDPITNDNPPPPGGCGDGALSPQEKVLEFMLFDLSSCVIPDSQAPSDGGVPIIQ